ncbi:PREDICTED: protein KRI1 homolog [Nelumbo nucifera]|uniref:Protein KRI1 homolog n=1 Tax=Nelumbo nucifera TaxID=4432 RepID=A0A1U7ZWL4_NELNU|nr:PREDICTED: protein KRI1 homolog [Nelumbo nucifera]XP_010256657.1 PREDICTED: protein KRI1 homolog [Nelumbo nucifera]
MGLNLFEGSGSDDENISKIEIDKQFARRFEHNKRREDLQRLEELKKRGLVDNSEDGSSESEDDEDEEVLINSGKGELQFLDALVKVKKKEPIINQKDTKLFESEDEEDDEEEEEEEKPKSSKEKPMYLKDVVAKQLIEEGPEFDDNNSKSRMKSYSEEQEELRQAFLNAAEEDFDGDEGDFLIEKKKSQVEDGEDEDINEIQKRLDEYFGEDEKLDENEMFLKNYFLNKMWIDKDANKGAKSSEEDLYGISEDEDEVEKQEKYEAEYNFRFEEGAGDRVLGHARFTEGSVRKKTNARKQQRKSKEERLAQAELERKEELKRLKNVKKKEIMDKLQKIRAIAGIAEGGDCALNEDDLEEDFDPEEYDRKMKETFDVDYYDAVDADPGFRGEGDEDSVDIEKPDFDKEDELLGLLKGWDVCGSGDGFLAAREKILKRKADEKDVELSDAQDQEEDEEEEELPQEGKRKRKRKISLYEKVALDKAMEEYYKLDYEDTIGDLKTRFKYTSVLPQRYGLGASEILMMDDKELNQYVSLKKIAPYREKEWKVPKMKRYNLKMKNKSELQGKHMRNLKAGKHRKKGDDHAATLAKHVMEQDKAEAGQLNGEVGTTSRRSRRRRRQAELKLSQSRLMAYGKIPSKPKSKKKQ